MAFPVPEDMHIRCQISDITFKSPVTMMPRSRHEVFQDARSLDLLDFQLYTIGSQRDNVLSYRVYIIQSHSSR